MTIKGQCGDDMCDMVNINNLGQLRYLLQFLCTRESTCNVPLKVMVNGMRFHFKDELPQSTERNPIQSLHADGCETFLLQYVYIYIHIYIYVWFHIFSEIAMYRTNYR